MRRARRAILTATLALAMPPSADYAAAAGNPLAGLKPMNAAALRAQRGGFIAPGGLEITVGFDVQNTLNGQIVVPKVTTQGNPPSAAVTAQLVSALGQGQISSLVVAQGGQVSTVVQNSLNNTVIQQMRRLNISIANFTQLQPLSGIPIAQLTAQLNQVAIMVAH